jgi:hypothetical protein
MSIKLWIIIICSVIIYNIYYDTSLFTKLKNYKKYYKIAVVLIMGFGALTVINKSPKASYQNMKSIHDFIQVMPIDRQSKDILTPFFQSSQPQYNNINNPQHSINTINRSGKGSTKRSVSETKKKYVASQQNWKCKHCQNQLTAWFEVDHVQRLEHGGSNEVTNLEALCRECHGKKTSMENM